MPETVSQTSTVCDKQVGSGGLDTKLKTSLSCSLTKETWYSKSTKNTSTKYHHLPQITLFLAVVAVACRVFFLCQEDPPFFWLVWNTWNLKIKGFDILYNPLQCYTVTVHLHIYQKTNADQKPWRKTNLCKSKIFFGSGTLSNNVAVQQSVDKILKIGVSKRPMAVGKKFLSNLFDNTILVQHQNFDSNLEQQPICLVSI